MRRFVVPLTLLFVVAGGLQASGQVYVDVRPDVGQTGFADWTILRGNGGTWYVVHVTRTVDPDVGPVVWAVVAKGRCHVQRNRHSTIIGCGATGRARAIPQEDFVMDPTLSNATLRVENRKYTHQVTWTGEDAGPTARTDLESGASPGGEAYLGADGGLFRWAPATARLFGRNLRDAGMFGFHVLYMSAGVSAYGYAGSPYRAITQSTRPDGSIIYRRVFRLPA